MPLSRILLASVSVISLAMTAGAQNDPFGGPDPLGGRGAANSTAEQPLTEEQALMNRQLLGYAARGPVERATAIASMVRTGRWQTADQLLSSTPGLALDTPTLSRMYQQIGPALFVRMKQSEQLSEAAKSALDRIAAAATAAAKSVERIRQAIDALDDPSSDARLDATRVLIGGGTTAAAELAAAAVSESPAASRKIILRALIEFEPLGTDALERLALYGTPSVRNRAMQALGWLDRDRHLPAYLSAFYASDSTSIEKQTAQYQLEQLFEQVPTKAMAIDLLDKAFRRAQLEAEGTDNDDQSMSVWVVNDDREGVRPQTTSTILAAYRNVTDAGARLRRIGGLSPALTGAVLSADVGYQVMVDPDWGDPDQTDAVRASYGTASGAAAVSAAIERATRLGDSAAAIGLMRLISPDLNEVDRLTLLATGGAKPTPLVMAALNSEPQVRYEAALAASRLAEGSPYAGSSHVRKTLAEMTRLGDEPTAILVETRPDIVIRVESLLSSLGYDTIVVRSVAQVQRAIERGGDLRLILSKIELADLSPIEMVDLVRRAPRGRRLPIVFYGPEDPALQWKRWDAPTIQIDRPSSVAAFDEVIDLVRRSRRIPPLSVIDRQSYRADAQPKPAP